MVLSVRFRRLHDSTHDIGGRGRAWLGLARPGRARLGTAWRAWGGVARRGTARRGMARRGTARQGGHGTVLTKAPTRQPTKKDNRWPNT